MDIYEEVVRMRREGKHGALATIVNVRGSMSRTSLGSRW
jgi:hypothetical protein